MSRCQSSGWQNRALRMTRYSPRWPLMNEKPLTHGLGRHHVRGHHHRPPSGFREEIQKVLETSIPIRCADIS